MIQGRIVVDTERCKGCALCVGVCPQRVLALSEEVNAAGYHPARLLDTVGCTGCAVCALICPDAALTVYRQKKQEPRTKNQELRTRNQEPEPKNREIRTKNCEPLANVASLPSALHAFPKEAR
jgi:2-oxoglutarate ferredoxin oxidoreductase subunit delta